MSQTNLLFFVKDGPLIKLVGTPDSNAVSANELSSVAFGCISEGYPVPNIKWKFNGADLKDFGINQTNSIKHIWIEFKKVNRKNNGTYTCYLNDKVKHEFDLLVKCKIFDILKGG